MRCQCWIGALVAFGWLVSPVCGQALSEDREALQQQIRALQEKLSAVERAGLERRRVTPLGTARPKEEEPQLVTRVYDLSDLFSLAMPYPAVRTNDLTGKSLPTAIFPPAAGPSSATGVSGVGGMGGMSGAGGGFFSVRGGERPRPSQPQPQPAPSASSFRRCR